jgi:hypothetical protein
MNIFVEDAKYIGNFKFDIKFNDGQKIVDIKKVGELDSRYNFVTNESIVSNMKKEGPSIAYQHYDIAPELLYQASL